MDDTQAQIKELQQQIDFLRHQLACANAKILKCERDFKAFEASSSVEIARMLVQTKRILDLQNDTCRKLSDRQREIDLFLWPVINQAFPDFDRDMRRIIALIGEPTNPTGETDPKSDV